MSKTNEKYDNSIDYSQLLLSFSSAALHHLGEVEIEGKHTLNKELAKQNIDIIVMLAKKTENNLTPQEETLTKQLLADLRAKFIGKFN